MTMREQAGPAPAAAGAREDRGRRRPVRPGHEPRPGLVPRSIVGWFVLCWAVFLIGAVVVGGLLVSLYRQSTVEQLRRAEAAVAHGCDAIAGRYRFLVAGTRAADPHDAAFAAGLVDAVRLALRDLPGVEGGVWRAEAGSLAYAFPTYDGGGEKTDLPAAERPRIEETATAAALDGQPVARRYDGRAQVLLLDACPLPATPVPGLAAWTMARVVTTGGAAYLRAAAGLGVLLAALAASAALLGRLLWGWSRRLRAIEAALGDGVAADAAVPRLERTGQRDLDRIVDAVNRAGERLDEARREADRLSHRVAEGERLAALGRVAAGVAHEIRNPIAAMRLKAENALAAAPAEAPARARRALAGILEQIGRLDALLRNLLTSVQRHEPRLAPVDIAALLAGRADLYREQAAAAGLAIRVAGASPLCAVLDPDRVGGALDNLILNAIQNTQWGGWVALEAARDGDRLVLSVADSGAGVPPAIRDRLFEPFVTGRADGTGLGLAIVRETAEAHGGTVRALHRADGTTIRMELPWHAC